MTDRQLANFVYSKSGIPEADWQSHFSCDCDRQISQRPRNRLSSEARECYEAIFRSYRSE